MFFSFAIASSEKQEGIKEYFSGCKTIDEECDDFFRNAVRRFTYEGDKGLILLCKERLQEYEDCIEIKRRKVLEDFRQKYKIDNCAWGLCLKRAAFICKSNEKNKHRPFSKVICAKNFPQDALSMIKKEMKYHRFHSQRVHLLSNLENFCYGVRAPMENIIEEREGSISISTKKYSPGCLNLNPTYWEKADFDMKKFMSICMVEELLEPLNVVPRIIRPFWNRLMKQSEEFCDSHCLVVLQQRASIFSMLYASLRDHATARLIKRYANSMVNNCFTLGDYLLISQIELSWRIIKELESYSSREERVEHMCTVCFEDCSIQNSECNDTSEEDTISSGEC